MKHEMSSCLRESAGPVLANTQYQSACTTPDIQHLVPLSTQSSPSRTALVRMPTTSLPACGSERPKPARMLAGRDAAHVVLLLLLAARDQHRAGRQAREQEHQRGGVGVLGDLFHRDGEAEDAGARTAVLLRDHEAEQAGVAEELEEVLGVRRRSVSISRARGATFSWAILRTVAWSSSELRREVKRHRTASLPAATSTFRATRPGKVKNE